MRFWFDCRHKQTSFPMTLKNGGKADAESTTYVVCLECGREFPYDWDQMKISKKSAQQPIRVKPQYEPAIPM